MAKGTRDKILAAALALFSEKGFEGTNIRELSASLGLVKSGVYKHFKSKEEIWNALLDELIAYYEARFGSPAHLPPVPDSPEAFVAMTMRLAGFTIRDETVVKTRKLLTIEQFRDERARALATKYFCTALTEMFTPILSAMMDRGLLRRDDPAMLAFAYTAPISSLIHLCDREPEKIGDVTARIEAFSRHFLSVYGTGKASCPAETGRLRLYPASKEQMEALIAAERDADLKQAYTEMLEGCLTHPGEWPWYAAWMIELRDGTRIGDLCFKGLRADGAAEIGYGILEAYRGQGYAAEAVGAAVRWAFEQPGAGRVEAETEPDNKASQRVLEKCGFRPAGVVGEEGPRYFIVPEREEE